MPQCNCHRKGSSWPGLVCYLQSGNTSISLYMCVSQEVLCVGSPAISVLLAWFLAPGAYPGAPAVLVATGSLLWEQHRQLETIVSDSCLSAGTMAPLMGCGAGEGASFVWQCGHGRWLIGHDKPRGNGGEKGDLQGLEACIPHTTEKMYFKMSSTLVLCHEYIIQ